jgi:biopolymer transport protein ExbD
MLNLARQRKSRRPGLTPMIDVVFLLLVFFMLAARFGADQSLPISAAGGSGPYSGPPRLIDIYPDGLRLNGVETGVKRLLTELQELTGGEPATIVMRPRSGADVQRIIEVMTLLRRNGMTQLALVE